MKTYRLFCWNVNGIRAIFKKGFEDWLGKTEIDILALQETKIDKEKLTTELRQPNGYKSDWHHAVKKGYSGVVTYYSEKLKPIDVYHSMGIEEFDDEGRIIATRFKEFTLLNVYFPNGKKDDERLDYKLRFHEKFLEFCNQLKKDGENLVVCGDVNIAHREIDLEHPKPNSKYSGFLPIEREWTDRFLESGFIDSLRHVIGDKEKMYSWWSLRSGARERNVGWRIDYFYVDESLKDNIAGAAIHTEVMGSDHCPISLVLQFSE